MAGKGNDELGVDETHAASATTSAEEEEVREGELSLARTAHASAVTGVEATQAALATKKGPGVARPGLALDDTVATPPGQRRAAASGRGQDKALSRGDKVGRYVVLELIGQGGMGEVYAAYDPDLDRKIALKVMHPALSGAGATQARGQMTREAKAMAQLAHPNVIQVFDVGEVEGDVYIAMEFVEGGNLRQWLKEEQRSQDEILAQFRAAGEGLSAAHKAGLVHRDFKPDNVLVGTDGRVRVIDFGIAHVAAPEERPEEIREQMEASTQPVASPLATLSGMSAGTPAYMAPEQFAGEACDARTDQFSFAIALYEALYDSRPFSGNNVAELYASVAGGTRAKKPEGVSYPLWLDAAIDKALQVEAHERFSSVADLLACLTPPRPWHQRHRVLLGTTTVLGLVAITAVAAMQLGSDAKESSCDDAGRAFDEVYGQAHVDGIKSAFARSELGYAEQALDKTLQGLSSYREAWTSAREKNCRAAEAGEIGADLGQRAYACLDRRLREFEALTAVLEAADEDTIKSAALMVGELTPIGSCTNATLLGLGDHVESAEHTAIELALHGLKAKMTAAKYDEVYAESEELSNRARAIAFPEGHAMSLYYRGQAAQHLAALDEAEELLFESIRLADKADLHLVRARAWSQLVSLYANALDRPQEAERWFQHAVVANEKAGRDLAVEASMEYNLGTATYKKRDYDKAAERFRKSASLYERVYGNEHWRVSTTLSMLGATLRAQSRYEEAAELQAGALESTKRLLGDDHPRLASLHNGLANSLGRLQRFDESRANYQRALAITEAAQGPRHPSMAIYLINLSGLEERMGHFEASLKNIEKAQSIRVEKYGEQHPAVVRTLEARARLFFETGRLEEALAVQGEAVRLYQGIYPNGHSATADALTRYCDLLRRANRFSDARNACAASLEILEASAPDPRNLAWALTHAAWLEAVAGRPDTALDMARRAVALRDEHTTQALHDGETRFVLAVALAATGDAEAALEAASKAEKVLANVPPGYRYLLEECRNWREKELGTD